MQEEGRYQVGRRERDPDPHDGRRGRPLPEREAHVQAAAHAHEPYSRGFHAYDEPLQGVGTIIASVLFDFDVLYLAYFFDFGVLYLAYAGQLAASTRWRRGKLFGGSLRPLAGQRLAELGDGGGADYRVEDS